MQSWANVTFIKIIKINPPFAQTFSERVISQYYWWTFRHVKWGECLLGQNHMSWSSRINDETRWAWCASNQCLLFLYILNLILLPSSLSYQEGRCHYSPGVGSACLFASSCRRFQNDFPYCNMRTCSFLLCSYSSGGYSWNLEAPLETYSCLSFSQVAF